MRNTDEIIQLAKKNGWWLYSTQPNICLLIFKKKDQQINVYYSKMTVATVLNHPKQGRQQLYRKDVTRQELEKLFKNPRQHTGKGFRVRLREFLHVLNGKT